MRIPVRRLALAAAMAGGLGLALPAAAGADLAAQDDPPQAGGSAVSIEQTFPQGQTPAGAPATDSALVIGVGVAALAGAAGLFAAAQHAARRT